MTIMTVHIPEDVKAVFDKAFEGEDKERLSRACCWRRRRSAGRWRRNVPR